MNVWKPDDLRAFGGVAVLNSLRGGSEVSQERVALEAPFPCCVSDVKNPFDVFDFRLFADKDGRSTLTHSNSLSHRPSRGAVTDSAVPNGRGKLNQVNTIHSANDRRFNDTRHHSPKTFPCPAPARQGRSKPSFGPSYSTAPMTQQTVAAAAKPELRENVEAVARTVVPCGKVRERHNFFVIVP